MQFLRKTHIRSSFNECGSFSYVGGKFYTFLSTKKHIPSLTKMEDTDQEILMELMKVIQKVATDVEEKYGACRVITNLGNYQESKHLHWHIVSGDKRK